MRMARVNVTIPDDVLQRARTAGLNVSRVATSALSEELDRRSKIAALDDYLRELDVALGPVPLEDASRGVRVGGPRLRRQRPGGGSRGRPRLVTLVLDSGGLTALAAQRARLHELRRRGLWPAQVPAVVLAESLTGDHRRDFDVNRLLRACQVRDVDEPQAREAARLRATTGRAGSISAVDAVVVAARRIARDRWSSPPIARDLGALAEHAPTRVSIVAM